MTRGKRFSAFDLFCGCGGLSLGLTRAGFDVKGAIDNDNLAVKTYRENHPDTRVFPCDIRSLEPEDVMDDLRIKPGELDLLAGCPPCQGFSALRTFNGSREFEEPMNDLIFQFSRFVRAFRPRAIMMENVPALRDNYRMEELRLKLDELEYKHSDRIFDAANFGVAQRRKRMILVGARDGCPDFAKPLRRYLPISEALWRLDPPEKTTDPMHNYDVQRSDKVTSLIRRIPKDGGSRTALPDEDQLPCHRKFDGFRDIYGRMAWSKPAPTITGGCINPSKGRFLHPYEHRAITLREAARLQGFPGGYKFDMTRGRYRVAGMIGNAFPPNFAKHHALAIRRHLESTPSSTR